MLVPFSVIPGGQERFAMDPSIGRPLCIILGVLMLSAADRDNNPQLAVHVRTYVYIILFRRQSGSYMHGY